MKNFNKVNRNKIEQLVEQMKDSVDAAEVRRV